MAQHKHNKPCAHRHSDLWWPSKAHKPVTVTKNIKHSKKKVKHLFEKCLL